MTIKNSSAHWDRSIPPWATAHTCDVRRYRGPYKDIQHRLSRQGEAVQQLRSALKEAASAAAEYLVVRHGKRSPRQDTVHRLMRDLATSSDCANQINVTKSRQHPDRLVLALKSVVASGKSRRSIEPRGRTD